MRFDKLQRRVPIVRPLSAVLAIVAASLLAWRSWRKPESLADELRQRGASLGAFESTDPGKGAGYGRQLRNAMRTDLMFDLPVVGARLEFVVPGGRTMSIGAERANPGVREPLRIDGQYTLSGAGRNRLIEATIRVIDPRSNEQRAAIVERGSLLEIDEVVMHLGDRLRAVAGVVPPARTRLSPSGAAEARACAASASEL